VLPQWVFFSLKDAESGALLRCGLHAGVYRRIGVNLEEGMAVRVEGYGKLAARSGNFGFWVSAITPVGEGALRRAYELLLKKLAAEGLFARKRDLPVCISSIGVISSRNGVVIQDLMKNLKAFGIRVDFVHSGVEGAQSAAELLRAIRYFTTTKDRPQVLILIRGGGSLESLQGFNNEAVCRALFAAPMPVLVGIGHDVDAPIATLVADRSVSTPTAVAHVINDSWAPLTQTMPRLARTISTAFAKRIQTLDHRTDLAFQSARHAVRRLIVRFAQYQETLARAKRRLPVRLNVLARDADVRLREVCVQMRQRIGTLRRSVAEYERLLAASDPRRILARGYSLAYRSDGSVLRTIEDVAVGEEVHTRLQDGTFEAKVTRTQREYRTH